MSSLNSAKVWNAENQTTKNIVFVAVTEFYTFRNNHSRWSCHGARKASDVFVWGGVV